MFRVCLVEPEIPSNTGNVGRTCLALGAELHLVGRLGFHLGNKELKRAGLDYWEHVQLVRHESWTAFEAGPAKGSRLHFFSTKGVRPYWEAEYRKGDFLVFGRESSGLPPALYERYQDHLVVIPQPGEGARSLNLSTSVGIGLYEAYRQVHAG